MGCYMKINDKTYADVIKAEEITTCPHCGRVLYIETEETEYGKGGEYSLLYSHPIFIFFIYPFFVFFIF